MKVRIVVRPSGLLNGEHWPEVGQTIDLPDNVAAGMAANGDVEPVETVEKRPASKTKVETRKSAAKKV